jgi:hypothetical protein
MPLKLIEPRQGKSPNWTIRGAYLGVRVNQTTGTADRKLAARKLAKIRDEIERGAGVAGDATAAMGDLRHAIVRVDRRNDVSDLAMALIKEISLVGRRQRPSLIDHRLKPFLCQIHSMPHIP